MSTWWNCSAAATTTSGTGSDEAIRDADGIIAFARAVMNARTPAGEPLSAPVSVDGLAIDPITHLSLLLKAFPVGETRGDGVGRAYRSQAHRP